MPFEDQRFLDAFDGDERDFGTIVANQKLNCYIENILKPLIPHYERASSMMSGYNPEGAELTMSTFGKVLKRSQFYFSEVHTDFIHFTNIKNARSIITEGCVYLSGLNTSSDSNEIELNLKSFEKQNQSWNTIQAEAKNDFLNLSLSPFREDPVFLEMSFQNIQNNYYQFGSEFPIGLVFEIDLSNRDEWWCYHLSKVFYSNADNEPPEFLRQLAEKTISWSATNHFEIYKMAHALYPLMAFFKENKYKMENEIRLIKAPISSVESTHMEQPLFNGYSINSRNQLVKIEKLYFEGPKKTEMFQRTFQIDAIRERRLIQTPKIKLKKILLPTLNFESLSLKETFKMLLYNLKIDAEVNYIEFHHSANMIRLF